MHRRLYTKFRKLHPRFRNIVSQNPSILATPRPNFVEATLLSEPGGYKIMYQDELVAVGKVPAMIEDVVDTMGVIGYYPIPYDCIQVILNEKGRCYLRVEHFVEQVDELDEHPHARSVLKKVNNKICIINPYWDITRIH